MNITDEYCRRELKRLGYKIKIPKTLFNEKMEKKFTLEQAIDHALNDKYLSRLNIKKEDYVNLTRCLLFYKVNKTNASKELEKKYFPNRWQLRSFIDLLLEYGHIYMSNERLVGYINNRIDEFRTNNINKD